MGRAFVAPRVAEVGFSFEAQMSGLGGNESQDMGEEHAENSLPHKTRQPTLAMVD